MCGLRVKRPCDSVRWAWRTEPSLVRVPRTLRTWKVSVLRSSRRRTALFEPRPRRLGIQ